MYWMIKNVPWNVITYQTKYGVSQNILFLQNNIDEYENRMVIQ